jgi:hypothetical protein
MHHSGFLVEGGFWVLGFCPFPGKEGIVFGKGEGGGERERREREREGGRGTGGELCFAMQSLAWKGKGEGVSSFPNFPHFPAWESCEAESVEDRSVSVAIGVPAPLLFFLACFQASSLLGRPSPPSAAALAAARALSDHHSLVPLCSLSCSRSY